MYSVVANVDWNEVARVREYELVEARNVQLAMVAAEPLRAHGVEVAKSFLPAAEVGGDFLDYFLLSDDKVGLYVGDVTGKGLPAALYASRSEEHTSDSSHANISYAVFCLKKKITKPTLTLMTLIQIMLIIVTVY